MSSARIYGNSEEFVYGDWMDTLPRHQTRFAAILSDLTSGNLAYEQRAAFYDYVTNALMDGGVFCDKVLTHPGDLLRVADLVVKYSRLPLNLVTVNHFSCEMLFCSELLDDDYILDSTRFYAILEGSIRPERVLRFVREAPKITPHSCQWYYGRRWGQLERSYCPRLVQHAVVDDDEDSPYFGRLKLFVCRKPS